MSFKYIDTHAHLNLAQFSEDANDIIKRCLNEDVAVINIGVNKVTSQRAVTLATENENLFAMVGVHPINAVSVDPDDIETFPPETTFNYDFYHALAVNKKVVGIGECGFDYFHNSDITYETQREVFLAQIALANELKKPLMLHLRNNKDGQGRNAYDDAYEILKTEAMVGGNVHFYAGTYEQAKQFFDLGYTVSFTGVITFAKPYEELIRQVPLEMIHGETDSPYVAPIPYRGKRCEPWMVKEIYKKIAKIKELDEEEVQEKLLKNAQNLYHFSS